MNAFIKISLTKCNKKIRKSSPTLSEVSTLGLLGLYSGIKSRLPRASNLKKNYVRIITINSKLFFNYQEIGSPEIQKTVNKDTKSKRD